MPFDGEGTFASARNFTQDANDGLNIQPDLMDQQFKDIASALSNCLTRDGQGAPIANFNMAGKKIVGMADGTANGDAVTLGQILLAAGVETLAEAVGGGTLTKTTVVASGNTLGGKVYTWVLPNGLQIVTGSVQLKSDGSGNAAYTFPTAFVNECLAFLFQATNLSLVINGKTSTKTGFTIATASNFFTYTFHFVAFGS